ncbi:MAG: hypothetical protein K2N49_01995 [Ruminococcus sp.]|nr:hypothetical protein [Ruminococcus sp.]MDE7225621.1 hypothetical protein [Ruminococcus sp.]
MFTRRELENAITELESKVQSFSDCEKLSALYTIYNQKFAPQESKESRTIYTETIVDDYGDSEFFEAIRDKDAGNVWSVMEELMAALQLFNPKLYNATLRKIDSL